MRTVLFVAHDYAPLDGAGAQRVLQFARHLPAHGFQPLVLTTTRFGPSPSDESGHVHRAPDWIHDLFLPLRRLKARGGAPRPLHEVPVFERTSAMGRLRDAVMVPDTRLGWRGPAVSLGDALILRERPALIFSSSPPETAHMVAARLARRHALPWVADLRDGWTFEPPNPAIRRGALRRALEARLERRMVRLARALTTATAPIAADLERRYPEAARRIATITNGYDASEFQGLARRRGDDGTLLLVHTGALSSSRAGTSARALFAALAAITRRDPRTPLRVRFVGATLPAERAAAEAQGLGGIVSFVAPVSRREAHQHQLDADALLLVTAPGQRSVATLKLFDYIGAGRPVLALAQDSAAAAIVEHHHLGITAPPDDPEAIALALEDLLRRREACADRAGVAQAQEAFEWGSLTARLAGRFEAVLRDGAAAGRATARD